MPEPKKSFFRSPSTYTIVKGKSVTSASHVLAFLNADNPPRSRSIFPKRTLVHSVSSRRNDSTSNVHAAHDSQSDLPRINTAAVALRKSGHVSRSSISSRLHIVARPQTRRRFSNPHRKVRHFVVLGLFAILLGDCDQRLDRLPW